MALINGTYEWAKSENMQEFLVGQGATITDDLLSKVNSGTLTIKLDGNKCLMTHKTGSDLRLNDITFGENFEENFGPDIKTQSVAFFDGAKITIISKGGGNLKETKRTYEFSERGCKITYSSPANKIEGCKYYKRA
ncbi:hypothetical protein QE152_g21796 [Popillia japonica]|uniref:Uncharacterized protein n=1 Tax=Popillia japonica TaxID=7064 RepID=A0AAW1KNJ7_POPJA